MGTDKDWSRSYLQTSKMKPKVPKTAVPLPPTRLVLRGLTCSNAQPNGIKKHILQKFYILHKKKKKKNNQQKWQLLSHKNSEWIKLFYTSFMWMCFWFTLKICLTYIIAFYVVQTSKKSVLHLWWVKVPLFYKPVTWAPISRWITSVQCMQAAANQAS